MAGVDVLTVRNFSSAEKTGFSYQTCCAIYQSRNRTMQGKVENEQRTSDPLR